MNTPVVSIINLFFPSWYGTWEFICFSLYFLNHSWPVQAKIAVSLKTWQHQMAVLLLINIIFNYQDILNKS